MTQQSHARAIVLLSCAAFASAASLRICDSLLPQLARAFGTTPGGAAVVVSGFSIAYGLVQAVFGPLGDRFGKYRMVAVATLASVPACIGCALATGLDGLFFFRVLSGATAAGVIPLAMAWIGDAIPYERRQPTLARFLSGQILGMVSGQLLGGFLADTLGWHWSFAVLALLFLVAGTMLLHELRRNEHTKRTGPRSAEGLLRGFRTQVGVVLRERWARVVLLTVFVEGMGVFGALAFIPSHLHGRFGLSLTGAGGVMAAYGAGGLCYTLVARRLVQRLGERGLAAAGGLILAASYILLGIAPVWWVGLPACLGAGLGFYMLHNTLQTHATQMAPAARGTSVSLFASAFFIGQSCGVAMAGRVMDRLGGTPLFVAVGVALPLVGAAFAWALTRRAHGGHGPAHAKAR